MARARGEGGGGRGGGSPGRPSIPVGYGSRRTYTYTPGSGSRNQSPGGSGLPGGCVKIILWLIVIAVIALIWIAGPSGIWNLLRNWLS